jgi:hypothetical protein
VICYVVGLDCQKYVVFEFFLTYKECYLYFLQNSMNMGIQPIKQLEAEYTTFTEFYDVMLSVKKGLKDLIKDKFYCFSRTSAGKAFDNPEKKFGDGSNQSLRACA